VALVDHDHVEIVGRIVPGQERDFLLFLPIDAEALVGRDVNARILSRVAALGVARDLSGLAAEQVGERRRRLGAQLVAVADKQGAPRHPRVEETPQHIRRDERLACAGRERQKRALVAARDFLEHGPDRRVLVIAPCAFAAAIGREQGAGGGSFKIDSGRRLPFEPKLLRFGKVGDRRGVRGQPGSGIVKDELMTVAREDEGNVEAARIVSGLFHAVARRASLGLGFDKR
jgi:hypothetical protein